MFVDFGRPGKNWLHLADKMYRKKPNIGKLICFSCYEIQGNQIISHQSFIYRSIT